MVDFKNKIYIYGEDASGFLTLWQQSNGAAFEEMGLGLLSKPLEADSSFVHLK